MEPSWGTGGGKGGDEGPRAVAATRKWCEREKTATRPWEGRPRRQGGRGPQLRAPPAPPSG